MAVRDDFSAGEVLSAADLNDTFASKLAAADQTIVQVVRATDSTARTTTSSSLVDASLSVTITPTSATNAVLLVSSHNVIVQSSGAGITRASLVITDSSNNVISGAEDYIIGAGMNTTQRFRLVLIAYATPATTSATTYKVRFRNVDGETTTLENNNITAQLYAIEVSA